MYEIQAVERMPAVLDPAVQVYAAAFAGVALNRRFRVDDGQLVRVRGDADFVARYYRHDREQRAFGLPAFGATASMVVRRLGLDGDFDRVRRTLADQCSACEILGGRLEALIDGGVD